MLWRTEGPRRTSRPSPRFSLRFARATDLTIATMPARFAEVGDRHAAIDDVSHGLTPLLERHEHDRGEADVPYPPNFPKMPGEPSRVQPSRAKR
jgi:hypothetical protein